MLLIASLLLAAGASAAPAAPAAPAPGSPAPPHLTVEPPVFDAGVVPRGTAVDAVFTVRNLGGEVLRLLSVRPG